MTTRGNRVLIMYNQDFPELGHDSEEPPSQQDDCFQGLMARAEVQEVAQHIQHTLTCLGYSHITIQPVRDIAQIKRLVDAAKFDFVFNLCESLDGNPFMEVEIAKILEAANIPFTGNSSIPLSNCLDKFHCTKVLKKAKVKVPESFLITKKSDIKKYLHLFERYPSFIVKPNAQDGSTGIESSSVVKSPVELIAQTERLLDSTNEPVIVQEFIEGREINFAIIGNDPNSWSCSEIDFSELDESKPKILNYFAKWYTESEDFTRTKTICPTLSPWQRSKLIQAASKTIAALGMNGYGRVDFRLSDQDVPYVIDVNPNCDLDPQAGFSKAAAYRGISYMQLVVSIMDWAEQSHHERMRLKLQQGIMLPHVGKEAIAQMLFNNSQLAYEN